MAGLDKIVEKLNSQKSVKKKTVKHEKEEEEVDEETEDEEDEGLEDEEESEGEEEDNDDEEEFDEGEDSDQSEDQNVRVVKKKTMSVPSAEEEAKQLKLQEINLLHNDGVFRYELLSQLIVISESLKTFNDSFNAFSKLLKGDGKKS